MSHEEERQVSVKPVKTADAKEEHPADQAKRILEAAAAHGKVPVGAAAGSKSDKPAAKQVWHAEDQKGKIAVATKGAETATPGGSKTETVTDLPNHATPRRLMRGERTVTVTTDAASKKDEPATVDIVKDDDKKGDKIKKEAGGAAAA